jgi:hypothetical protein
LDNWPAILLGWPAILLALGLAVSGIVRNKARWPVIGAVLVLPISLYLAGSPRFGWLALSIPLSLAGTSIAIYLRHTKLAWLLLVPFVGTFGWLAVIVMSE